MADLGHVAIVEQGTKAIADWRKENPGSVMDLSGAKFIFADLDGADFSGANCKGANLFGAELRNADFTGADLTGADIFAAVTPGANFKDANLEGVAVCGGTRTGAESFDLLAALDSRPAPFIPHNAH